MDALTPTHLTLLLQRCPQRDASSAGISYSGYDLFWPDGRPVRAGLHRFCRVGERLLVGRDHAGDTALVRLTLYPVAGLEAALTRPGRGIRCRRFYAVRQPSAIRLHFLDGTRTDVVFDPAVDEPEVLRWLQENRMLPVEPFWFDLASQTLATSPAAASAQGAEEDQPAVMRAGLGGLARPSPHPALR